MPVFRWNSSRKEWPVVCQRLLQAKGTLLKLEKKGIKMEIVNVDGVEVADGGMATLVSIIAEVVREDLKPDVEDLRAQLDELERSAQWLDKALGHPWPFLGELQPLKDSLEKLKEEIEHQKSVIRIRSITHRKNSDYFLALLSNFVHNETGGTDYFDKEVCALIEAASDGKKIVTEQNLIMARSRAKGSTSKFHNIGSILLPPNT
jgi:hypothetical protein